MNTASELLLGSLSSSSRKLYKKALEKFHIFQVGKLRVNQVFPAHSSSVMLYIAHMINQGYAVSTIASNLSAISFFHRLLSKEDPTSNFIIRKIMSGAAKIHKISDTRLPITIEILKKLIDTVHYFTESIFATLLFKSMFSLMFHAFLRIGEATSSNNNLQISQVSISPSFISLEFDKFKHHAGPPVLLTIPSTNSKYCPVKFLTSYIRMRGNAPGPLFCDVSLSAVQPHYFTSILTRCLEWNGLQNLNIKPHSFRIGAATFAAMIGYSDIQIQAMGRWKSSAFKKYIRIKSFEIKL